MIIFFVARRRKCMRKRLYEIIDNADGDDKLSRYYDLLMMITIVISLVPLCTKSIARWTFIVDIATVSIFIIDYILREFTADFKLKNKGISAFFLYPFSFFALIDLLSILPSFGILGSGMKALKIFRLFRTLKVFKALKAMKAFRALKLARYSHSVGIILNVINKQKEALLTVGGFAIGYIFIAALVIFNVEPDSFGSFFDALYWACVSLTTVGYGDIYPISTAGRLVTMFSSFVGIAIVALPSGIITAGYMDEIHKVRESSQHTTADPK